MTIFKKTLSTNINNVAQILFKAIQTAVMTRLLMYSLLGICIHARPFSQRTKGSCSIFGEMKVEEKMKGVVRVSELSEGDVIFGMTAYERKPV